VKNCYKKARRDNLQDTDSLTHRHRRLIGDVLCLPTRPVSMAINFPSESGSKRKGKPKKTQQDTLIEDDLQAVVISQTQDRVRSVAGYWTQ